MQSVVHSWRGLLTALHVPQAPYVLTLPNVLHLATDVTAVCVVAAPQGVQALQDCGHPVRLVTATVDRGLDENAYIRPGLGDAGDRQFGPRWS